MKTIEEKLWSYIDGDCTPDEFESLSRLIATDEVYRAQYEQLLTLNKTFAVAELDEPSMGFTYKVMETIRTENASQPLKAAIDKRIIGVIGAFFVLTIGALLLMLLASVNWAGASNQFKIPVDFKIYPLSQIEIKPMFEGFIFFDVVLALFLVDTYLRKKININ